jgi:MFS family permease
MLSPSAADLFLTALSHDGTTSSYHITSGSAKTNADAISFNTLLYYSGTIFGLLGLKNSAAAGLIPSGCNALCVFFGINLVDRVGRRKFFMIMIPGMFVGLVWAMISFYCE